MWLCASSLGPSALCLPLSVLRLPPIAFSLRSGVALQGLYGRMRLALGSHVGGHRLAYYLVTTSLLLRYYLVTSSWYMASRWLWGAYPLAINTLQAGFARLEGRASSPEYCVENGSIPGKFRICVNAARSSGRRKLMIAGEPTRHCPATTHPDSPSTAPFRSSRGIRSTRWRRRPSGSRSGPFRSPPV